MSKFTTSNAIVSLACKLPLARSVMFSIFKMDSAQNLRLHLLCPIYRTLRVSFQPSFSTLFFNLYHLPVSTFVTLVFVLAIGAIGPIFRPQDETPSPPTIHFPPFPLPCSSRQGPQLFPSPARRCHSAHLGRKDQSQRAPRLPAGGPLGDAGVPLASLARRAGQSREAPILAVPAGPRLLRARRSRVPRARHVVRPVPRQRVLRQAAQVAAEGQRVSAAVLQCGGNRRSGGRYRLRHLHPQGALGKHGALSRRMRDVLRRDGGVRRQGSLLRVCNALLLLFPRNPLFSFLFLFFSSPKTCSSPLSHLRPPD